MAKTPITNVGSYLSVADFLKGKDYNTVGQLCSDDKNAVPPGSLPTDENLAEILLRASGLFESAVLRGGRYTVADLQALPTGSAGKSFVSLIVSDIAMALLFERRPNYKADPQIMERSSGWLEALAAGEMIFGFQEVADAGVLEPQHETTEDVDARQGVTWITKDFFGRRSNRWPQA